jgi:hypothetical protein
MPTQRLYRSAEPNVISLPGKFADELCQPWPRSGDPTFWQPSAPDEVRDTYDAGDSARGWQLWQRYLFRGKRRKRDRQQPCRERLLAFLRKNKWAGALVAGDMVPPAVTRAAWLLDVISSESKTSLSASKDAAAAHADSWLAEQTNTALAWIPNEADAWEAIVWTHALLPLAKLLAGAQWWQLARQLHHLAASADVKLCDDPLAQQLAQGELPWTLACLLPELTPCRTLAAGARSALSRGMVELLDGKGLPHARRLRAFQPLMACWIRCRLASKFSRGGGEVDNDALCWDDDAEAQFPAALHELIRLGHPDGSPVLVGDTSGAAAEEIEATRWSFAAMHRLVVAAAEQILDKQDRLEVRALIAARSAAKKSKAGRRATASADELPLPSVHSEWARLAILATDWSPRANRLAVAYHEQRVGIDLEVRRRALLQGEWEFDVRADGVPALATGEWSEICWVNDADCDYLELELQLTEGLRLQRQMLLPRQDDVLFLADVLVGTEPRELSYRSKLPLADRVLLEPAAEEARDEVDAAMSAMIGTTTSSATSELVLTEKRPRAMALPLALSEWRADSRGGSLSAVEGSLELRQTARGCCLYAPLWLDLRPKRFGKPRTWRQLTVAEQLVAQPRDVAVGYRVQFGSRQWLVYRALTARGNRTLLGQNLSTEFFVGRFQRNGESESILEVE